MYKQLKVKGPFGVLKILNSPKTVWIAAASRCPINGRLYPLPMNYPNPLSLVTKVPTTSPALSGQRKGQLLHDSPFAVMELP
jgi:hypothetical protein